MAPLGGQVAPQAGIAAPLGGGAPPRRLPVARLERGGTPPTVHVARRGLQVAPQTNRVTPRDGGLPSQSPDVPPHETKLLQKKRGFDRTGPLLAIRSAWLTRLILTTTTAPSFMMPGFLCGRGAGPTNHPNHLKEKTYVIHQCRTQP